MFFILIHSQLDGLFNPPEVAYIRIMYLCLLFFTDERFLSNFNKTMRTHAGLAFSSSHADDQVHFTRETEALCAAVMMRVYVNILGNGGAP